MNTKVLICVPTVNRPNMVREVLEYELDYYTRLGFDICYYDSSDSEETINIIKDYRYNGYTNLFFKKTPKDQCIDVKLFDIFKNDIKLREYEYVWFVNDSISITEIALNEIVQLLDKKYDLIRLPLSGAGIKEDRVYTEPNKWFHECSQGMAHMASTIMSTALIKIEFTDWDYLYDKYIGNNNLNDENHGFFFTVGFYLEQIVKLQSFIGLFIGNHIKWRRDSPLKKDQIYWKDMIFRVWAYSYPNTILSLPDTYTDKEEVIRISDNIGPGRFSERMLLSYRLHGLLSRKVFIKYYSYFPLVSAVKISKIKMISCTPIKILKVIHRKSTVDETRWEQNLEKLEIIMNKYNRIIVFGAGLYGEKSVVKLKKDGFIEKLISVAVTDTALNVNEIEGIAVQSIWSLTEYMKDSIVLIAALPEAAKQINDTLKKIGFKHVVSLFK